MASAGYHVRQALQCLRQSPYAALVAAGTVAVALFVSALALLGGRAVESALRGYGADARITIFLDSKPPDDPATLVAQAVEAAGLGAKGNYVTPEHALARLKADLGEEAAGALDGLAVNPLPPSIEVRLASARLAQGELGELREAAARIGQLPFAKDVDYGAGFLERLETILLAVRALGLGLFAFVLGIALFLVGNVVRLTVYARRDEVDILRLVGATDGFIALPFVIEGALQGLAGGLVAMGLSLAAQHSLLPRLASSFGFGGELLPRGFGPLELVGIVLVGALTGALASFVAVHRFLRSSP